MNKKTAKAVITAHLNWIDNGKLTKLYQYNEKTFNDALRVALKQLEK